MKKPTNFVPSETATIMNTGTSLDGVIVEVVGRVNDHPVFPMYVVRRCDGVPFLDGWQVAPMIASFLQRAQ